MCSAVCSLSSLHKLHVFELAKLNQASLLLVARHTCKCLYIISFSKGLIFNSQKFDHILLQLKCWYKFSTMGFSIGSLLWYIFFLERMGKVGHCRKCLTVLIAAWLYGGVVSAALLFVNSHNNIQNKLIYFKNKNRIFSWEKIELTIECNMSNLT